MHTYSHASTYKYVHTTHLRTLYGLRLGFAILCLFLCLFLSLFFFLFFKRVVVAPEPPLHPPLICIRDSVEAPREISFFLCIELSSTDSGRIKITRIKIQNTNNKILRMAMEWPNQIMMRKGFNPRLCQILD